MFILKFILIVKVESIMEGWLFDVMGNWDTWLSFFFSFRVCHRFLGFNFGILYHLNQCYSLLLYKNLIVLHIYTTKTVLFLYFFLGNMLYLRNEPPRAFIRWRNGFKPLLLCFFAHIKNYFKLWFTIYSYSILYVFSVSPIICIVFSFSS